MLVIQEKVTAGNATQNIHPPLMQKTHIHMHIHTASVIHLLVKNTRDIYIKQR